MRGVAAILASCALVASGCGSDDDDGGGGSGGGGSAQPAPPSKAEYIRTADSECRKLQAKALVLVRREQKLFDQAAGADEATLKTTFRKIANLGEKRVGLRQQLSETLEGLDEPKSGGAERYLKARRAGTARLDAHVKNLRAYARSLSPEATNAVNRSGPRVSASSKRELKLARAYGFKVCGKVFKPR